MKKLLIALTTASIAGYVIGVALLTHLFATSQPAAALPLPDNHEELSAAVESKTAASAEYRQFTTPGERALVAYMTTVEDLRGHPVDTDEAIAQARRVCVAVADQYRAGVADPVARAVEQVPADAESDPAVAVQLVAAGIKFACPGVSRS